MHDDVHATPGHLNPGPGFDPEPVPDPGGALPPSLFAPLRRRVDSWLPTRAARRWALVLVLLGVVHLSAHLVVPDGVGVARVTQWLLMPLLAATLWCATPQPRPRPRLVQLAVVALLCSWAGDTVPAFVPDIASFPVLMALFLVAQLVYVAAFLPYRAHSVLVRRRGVVVGYAVMYAVIVGTSAVALLPQGGAGVLLVVGIAGYGAVLMTMALLATGVDRLAGLGGVLFLVSDALLGLAQALPDTIDALPPGVHGFLVMLTYLAAQTLLAAGVRRRVRGHG
ncbi:YhhN family protein [Xylanimonas cellulosilytica DSM 15894]|uniref:YhhN family protein n=1 Tax=Xylanimonas cellulosilytica (strain DSM 15894 / JCM 12276 / CECT 5975 / KCTC 9989 / LMG 20990 / NBRC 107835 / XIL07) TaxID=446471 RepID=D1BTH6_XYLCX|nr:lysoplasmalogenase [Xylanimonas cellulosilytica]ACZ30955.1 YhhN family protein [Xylanimonas cellulosilytica DSM 15894]